MIRFVLLAVSFLFSAQPIEGVVAVVGDNVVLQTDFIQQVQLEANKNNISPSESPIRYNVLAKKVLDNIINQYVILEHAKRDTTFVVTAEEVSVALDNQINNFITQVGSIQALEKIFNKPLRSIRSDYWEEIENVLYIDRFRYNLFGGVDVSRKEVLDFFNTHKDSLPSVPSSASFSIVHLPSMPSGETRRSVSEQLSVLKNDILSGFSSFDDVIKNVSENLGSGGDLGFTLRGSLFEEFESVAYNLSIGEIGGPVETPAGFHLIKLLDKRGEKIHTKHVLLPVFPSEKDVSLSLEKINVLYNKHKNQSWEIDRLALEYKDLYKDSFSGVFNNVYYLEVFPEGLASVVGDALEFSVVPPVVLDLGGVGFYVLSVYEKLAGGPLSPESSWVLLYNMAKNSKIDGLFRLWINKAKDSVYIKIFQEN